MSDEDIARLQDESRRVCEATERIADALEGLLKLERNKLGYE